jgi:uncharacterized protein (DUF1330 family)
MQSNCGRAVEVPRKRSTYRSINNTDAWAAYVKMAAPAIEGAGGRFIARGMPAAACCSDRVDNIAKATAAHDTAAYQAALKVLGNGVEREIRIVEGVA